MNQQPEALRLADWLDHMRANGFEYNSVPKAAAELRRLQTENDRLKLHASGADMLVGVWQERANEFMNSRERLRDINSRLHVENEDYGATCDHLIRENAEHIGEIVALKEQRDELLEALELFPGFTDDATIGDSWLLKVGSTIAKTGGAA